MKTQHLFKATSGLFLLRVFGAFLQTIFMVYLARKFGLRNFGIFTTLLTIVIISSVVAKWGTDQWILREFAANKLQSESFEFLTIMGNGLIIVVAISFFISAVLFLISGTVILSFSSLADIADTRSLIFMLLAITPFALVNFFSESLRALDRHYLSTFFQTTLIPFLCITFMIGVSYFQLKPLELMSLSYFLSCLITFIVASFFSWSVTVKNYKKMNFKWNIVQTFLELTPIAVVSLLSSWLAYADILLLSYFSMPSDVGLYSAAQRIVVLLSFIIVALNSVLGPKFSFLHTQKRYDEVLSLYNQSRLLMTIVVVPFAILIGIFSNNILMFFGSVFLTATPILIVLLVGRVLNVIVGPVEAVMMMLRHVNRFRNYTIISILFHLFLGVFLVHKFGAIGAAISTCLATALISYLCWAFVNSILSK